MSRKYKQKGYQDDNGERPRSRAPRDESAPRGRVETRFRRTIRCAECGAMVQFMDELKLTETCKGCGADLHTCRNCKFFDPGAPNECMRPVPQRIESKNTRNMCSLFSPKVIVEKAVEEKQNNNSSDSARKAFDDLFKI